MCAYLPHVRVHYAKFPMSLSLFMPSVPSSPCPCLLSLSLSAYPTTLSHVICPPCPYTVPLLRPSTSPTRHRHPGPGAPVRHENHVQATEHGTVRLGTAPFGLCTLYILHIGHTVHTYIVHWSHGTGTKARPALYCGRWGWRYVGPVWSPVAVGCLSLTHRLQ